MPLCLDIHMYNVSFLLLLLFFVCFSFLKKEFLGDRKSCIYYVCTVENVLILENCENIA